MGSETAARLKLENKFGTQSVESDKRPRGDGGVSGASPASFKLNAEKKVLDA